MKILIISQYFEPETMARGLTLATGLVKHGHTVFVLTGFPNYPKGELYPGYRQKLFFKEVMNGVTVYRVPTFISHDSNSFRRAANYLSFMFSAFILGLIRIPKFDVAYVYHPPITTCLSASMLCLFRRKPFICDIQDIWPDSVGATGMLDSPKLIGVLDKMCDFVYRRASHIVTISNGMKEKIVSRGVGSEKVSVVPNWCDEDNILNPETLDLVFEERLSTVLSGKFNIIFAGNIGEAQNLDAVVDAGKIAYTESPNIQFVFVGGGTKVEMLQNRCVKSGYNFVSFLPQIPTSQIGGVMKRADVLLVHLRSDPLFEITIPSKTQAYMAVGKPILMAVPGDANKIITEAQCGLGAASDDPQSIARACIEFSTMNKSDLSAMGRKARAAYVSDFSMSAGVERFHGLLTHA